MMNFDLSSFNFLEIIHFIKWFNYFQRNFCKNEKRSSGKIQQNLNKTLLFQKLQVSKILGLSKSKVLGISDSFLAAKLISMSMKVPTFSYLIKSSENDGLKVEIKLTVLFEAFRLWRKFKFKTMCLYCERTAVIFRLYKNQL